MNITVAQNPYWVFPPNYVNFKTGQVLALPAATSYTKTTGTSNGFFSQTGVSKFNLKMNGTTNYSYSNSTVTTRTGNQFNSTENLLIPSILNCNEYFTIASDIIVGAPTTSLVLQSISYQNSTYDFWGGDPNSNFELLPGAFLSVAASRSRSINATIRAFDLFTITKNKQGVFQLFKTTYQGSGFSLNKTVTFLATFSGNSSPSELDLSRDEKYLSWGDMNTGTLFIYNLTSSSLLNLSVAATKIYGVEFSKNSDLLYFTKNLGTSPGVGVYDLKTNTFLSDVPSTSDLQYSQLELAVDGYIYGSNGTSLKGFNSQSYSAGITKSFTVSNPISSNGVYTLVDQIDNLDYNNAFTYYSCKPVEYLSGTISGTNTYSASISVSNVGTANVSNAAQINITGGTSVTFNAGFNTNLSTSGYLRASIQPCSQTGEASCSSYRLEEQNSNTFVDDTENALAYPNPITSGYLNFSKTATNFTLVNVSGIEVLQGNNVDKISVDGLSKGLYLLHIDGKAMKVVIE